jgi:hypothetical protein
MPRTVTNVAESEVNFVIAMLKADGAIEITKTPQGGGLWTLIGRFPGDRSQPPRELGPVSAPLHSRRLRRPRRR